VSGTVGGNETKFKTIRSTSKPSGKAGNYIQYVIVSQATGQSSAAQSALYGLGRHTNINMPLHDLIIMQTHCDVCQKNKTTCYNK